MNRNLINAEYFKRGISINILQVSTSLVLGFASSIVYFSRLDGKEYVVYTLIQLTVFFFVNFSSLELNQYIRKYVPIMDEKKALLLLAKIITTVLTFFLFVIFIYYFVVNFSSIYSNFEKVKFLIYLSIFILSIVQIFVKFLSVFISAQEKFDILEKKNFYFLTPYKLISLGVFYFFSSTLLTAILINFFLRFLQLIIVFGLFGNIRKLFSYIPVKKPKIDEFNLFENLKFTVKNFLYMNYPLLFLSIIPTYLSKSYSYDDVAVFTLVLTLFNSVKPILNAISTLINPSIVNLKNINQTKELKLIIRTVTKIIATVHLVAIFTIWLNLNYEGFTQFFLKYFSYNLFSDFINSVIVISLFTVLTMIQQSYFLAANYETKFFITSLVSTTLSLIYILVFINYELNLNFVLGALVVFYCVKYFLSLYFTLGEINFSFLAPLFVLIIFPVSLITLKFNSFVIYAISEIVILFTGGYLIRKFYYQLKLGS